MAQPYLTEQFLLRARSGDSRVSRGGNGSADGFLLLLRNLDFTMGRPTGANGDGLAGGDVSDRVDAGRSEVLSAAAHASSEPSSSSKVDLSVMYDQQRHSGSYTFEVIG